VAGEVPLVALPSVAMGYTPDDNLRIA
jgi:hypothetical protein